MELAALIIATIALVLTILMAIYLGAKHFSTHTIQREFVDPFKDSLPSQVGKDPMEHLRDLDYPISEEEIEQLRARGAKLNKNVK